MAAGAPGGAVRHAAAVPGWLHPLVAAVTGPGSGSATGAGDGPVAGRPSAVLVLFGEGRDGPDVLLIERGHRLRHHPGQPAFPGGAADAGDGGPADTALREAAEETGLDPAGVQVLATLPALAVPRSGFAVVPVLGYWREPTEVGPVDPAEVAAVVRVPVAHLVDPGNRVRVRHPGGWFGPGFEVGGLLVWGFTAGVLDRLLALGGFERPWRPGVLRDLPGGRADRADLSGGGRPAGPGQDR